MAPHVPRPIIKIILPAFSTWNICFSVNSTQPNIDTTMFTGNTTDIHLFDNDDLCLMFILLPERKKV